MAKIAYRLRCRPRHDLHACFPICGRNLKRKIEPEIASEIPQIGVNISPNNKYTLNLSDSVQKENQ